MLGIPTPMAGSTRAKALTCGAGVAAGVGVARALSSPAAELARMSGASIAVPRAAPWITDFLNSAYYRRVADERDVDDLRLAFNIVTTRWYRLGGRRLQAHDVVPFHLGGAAGRADARIGSHQQHPRVALVDHLGEPAGDPADLGLPAHERRLVTETGPGAGRVEQAQQLVRLDRFPLALEPQRA